MKRVREWARRRAAVFAANDEMAAGIIDAALATGLAVPEDLPVVGFDDTRIAAMTRPRLTTVRVPMSAMGAAAVDLLVPAAGQPEAAGDEADAGIGAGRARIVRRRTENHDATKRKRGRQGVKGL